jgi:hypothetical protein
MKFRILVTMFAVLLAVAAAPALAQSGPTVYAQGLTNPRNMSFDSAGTLYVADAGNGGPQMTPDDTPFGASGSVIAVSKDGKLTTVVHGLISYREGQPLGSTAVQVNDSSIWVLLGETSDFMIPFTHALVELDKTTGRVKTFVDLLTVELEKDPDGNPNKQSNPTDFAVAADGTIYIANAGCNCLLSWTAKDGVQVAAVWPHKDDNPVPTSVEIGPDGDIYVGFLTGFPWPKEAARVERWSGGQLKTTYKGLTAVTGLLLAQDGTLYAVELGVFEQGKGWGPGRVVKVAESGLTPVLENLTAPYGLAQSPDGTIVVSTGSIGGDDGQILVVPTN